MGEVPEDVLSGERRATLAPRKLPIAGQTLGSLKPYPVVSLKPETSTSRQDDADANAIG
jgi:hypothetical protein